MKELVCPNCHKIFKVDDTDYATILSQVRSKEFDVELGRLSKDIESRYKLKEESIKLKAQNDIDTEINKKDRELGQLQNEIVRLNEIISGYSRTKDAEIAAINSKHAQDLAESVLEKDKMITELESEISRQENIHKMLILEERNKIQEQIQNKSEEIVRLKAEIESSKLAATNRENQLKEQHQIQLRDKQDEIDRLKDFKIRLSTKMVGESLEQHCMIQFATAQSMGQYPDAIFEKDNIAVEHSKGDFIFRDFINGEEYVSVMFEMKNETDSTSIKHKNDDFLDKLDKDRHRKNCEYAVLVSMLESGNELYDAGIVDKSYRYPKMIVIRPQFFLPVLRIISEAAKKGFLEKKTLEQELALSRSQTMDFAKFESKLNKFRSAFSSNVTAAHKKFQAATAGIDKTIEALEKQIKALREIKSNFEASEHKLLKANELAEEDLTVKKLTYGNPTIKRLIQEAGEED